MCWRSLFDIFKRNVIILCIFIVVVVAVVRGEAGAGPLPGEEGGPPLPRSPRTAHPSVRTSWERLDRNRGGGEAGEAGEVGEAGEGGGEPSSWQHGPTHPPTHGLRRQSEAKGSLPRSTVTAAASTCCRGYSGEPRCRWPARTTRNGLQETPPPCPPPLSRQVCLCN